MRERKKAVIFAVLIAVFGIMQFPGKCAAAEKSYAVTEKIEKSGEKVFVSEKSAGDSGENSSVTEDTIWNMAEEYLNLGELENSLQDMSDAGSFSFRETLRSLMRGDLDFNWKQIARWILGLFLDELSELKTLVFRILIVVFAGAIFSNFVHVFENSQIADISFYMIYLLACTLLVKAFSVMYQMTVNACESILQFMQVLLPSYLVTVVLSSGTATALGFYEITVLVLQIFQAAVVRVLLPGIQFYLILLILNQISAEDNFSRFAQLIELAVGWSTKTMLGAVIGLQAIQCLTAPAVDSLKNSAVQRLAKTIPGIGSALDAASETVAGSALILKNAVGVTGMIALAVLCLTPIVKLGAAILMFRILCALIQPICEKRLVEEIESVAKGAMLLLHVLIAGMSVFIISLAMVTASVRGG